MKGYMAGAVHRDFKGSVVMLSTNHKHLTVPKSEYRASASMRPLPCVRIEDTILNPELNAGSDESDYELLENDGEILDIASSKSNNSESTNSGGSVVHVRPRTRSSPKDPDCEEMDELTSLGAFSESSGALTTLNSMYDSDEYGEQFDQCPGEDLPALDHTTMFGKYELPTTLDLMSEPTQSVEYINAYNWEPKKGPTPKNKLQGSFKVLNEHVTLLTEDQGTKDWHLLRRFLVSSTVAIHCLQHFASMRMVQAD